MTAPRTWFAPTCPTWCHRQHEVLLTDDGHPLTDLASWAAPSIHHARALVELPDGLAVELGYLEHHPQHGPTDDTPGLYVFLPEHHGAHPASPTQLRRWAHALTTAADLAETLTKGEDPR